jgi:hypothetical protein
MNRKRMKSARKRQVRFYQLRQPRTSLLSVRKPSASQEQTDALAHPKAVPPRPLSDAEKNSWVV